MMAGDPIDLCGINSGVLGLLGPVDSLRASKIP
jgi:hypothetical protein